jgi:uncharacterized protein (DUF2235 family)
MKRIVFCFDGTWNRLDAPNPTNVVITAQSITPVTSAGVTQIIHYDEGVGTGAGEKYGGGLFGHGLLTNMADAFRFLIFNYTVGDEIYIFGFSRGAYTARSFAGLLRNCGILRRRDAAKITDAVRLYQNRTKDDDQSSEQFQRFRLACSPDICVDAVEDAWRVKNSAGYVTGQAPILRIRFLGIWDTVGALGIPKSLFIAPFMNRKYNFHDHSLTKMVVSARHAVAIDEKRASFAPTLWDNLEDLNRELGFHSAEDDAPYQQKWFPGTHGSIGGGGDVRGLADEALDWVISGARAVGLELDTSHGSPIFNLKPDHRATIECVSSPRFSLMSLLPTEDRLPGPNAIDDVSINARMRWAETAENLPERKLYRPKTLANVAAHLNAAVSKSPPPPPVLAPTQEPTPGFHTVRRGDTLSKIAKAVYGDATRFPEIFNANRGMLSNPDRIYIGQVLRIP